MGNLYRNKAMEHQAMADRLDLSLKIIKPRYWVAIVGAIILVVAVIIWGCFGHIDTTVDTYGYYLTEGIFNFHNANENGEVVSLSVSEGSLVHKGDTLYKYRDANGQIKEEKSTVTGVVAKNNIFPGSNTVRGQETNTIRAITINENGQQLLWDDSSKNGTNIEYENLNKKVYVYVPLDYISDVEIGKEVKFKDLAGNYLKNITGHLTKVKKTSSSPEEISSAIGVSVNSKFATQLADGSFCECEISFDSDDAEWPFNEGDIMSVSIFTKQTRPINLIF